MSSSFMSITVVTVSGPNDGPLVDRNVRLMESLNPDAFIELRVVDNSIPSGGAPVEASHRWELFDGVALNDPDIDLCARASSHHGLALNRCLAARPVNTRYLLILDPDFFIYYRHWVEAVTCHMASRNLAFFGAPWHPRWFTKFRGFPCVHCLFIDTTLVDVASLDFSPNLGPSLAKVVQSKLVGKRLTRSPWTLLLSYIYSMTLLRLDIGRSQDTGSRIFRQARRSGVAAELLVPHVRTSDFHGVRHLRGRMGRLMEQPWPDRLSFIPKQRGYFSRHSALSPGLDLELTVRGWEEFQWREQLFGIHMRRYAQPDNGAVGDNQALLEALDVTYNKASI
jgi:hypothetical protein